MQEDLKIKDHQEWHGTYKGVSFEIVKWKGYDHYIWNYYIIVKPREIIMTEETKIGESVYGPRVDYYAMYSDIEMHGGVTFWQGIINSTTGKRSCDKVGCDFSHLWDMERGYNYDLEDIKRQVVKTIDDLPEDLKFN